jgi:hypothetical protein
MDDNGFYLDGYLRNISEFDGELDIGRMPEADNEVVYLVHDYEFTEGAVDATYYLNGDKGSVAVSVVGVKYIDENMFNYSNNMVYGTSSLIEKYMININRSYSTVKVNINGMNYDSYNYMGHNFNIVASDRVRSGNAIVSDGISYACKNYNCWNKDMSINVDNLYYEDNLSLKISNVYTNKNVKNILGIDKDNYNYGSIFISYDDYNRLFNKDSYQASVFASRVDYVDEIVLELEELGYNTLELRKALDNEGADAAKVLKIVKLVVTVLLIVTLFFISYFVIKLILKSRNVYFSTLRILGATVRQTKRILDVELFINSSLAYITYVIFVFLIKKEIINIGFLKSSLEYLNMRDYVLMYIVLVIMSYLISSRFSSKLFKKSAMKSYREEV